jgi:two-component system response regulator MtrA
VSSRLLLVEDDPSVREVAALVLEGAGFEVVGLPDAPDPRGLRWDDYQLVVLDVMLPSADGVELCREIRSRSMVPIMMLTAKAETSDVVAGLTAGADDYVTKPFVPDELVARAQAAVRRHPAASPPTYTVRDLCIDELGFRASRGDTPLSLTATELRLLVALTRNAGQVLSREDLLAEVWGYDYLGDSRLVDMAVLRLRNKLGDATDDGPPYIATVRAMGYRFEP